MGWIDSIWGKRSDDPLGTLDPKLQEFLRKESPVKYDQPGRAPSSSTPTSNAPASSEAGSAAGNPSATSSSPDDSPAAAPPPQSLFPDGRYAHLWRSYTPLADIEAASKSDSEKLTDVVTAFKERKKEIGRAAIENCAEWQEAWRECFSTGTWGERTALCAGAVRRFERCYATNVRLLKALGYQSAYNRAPELDEDIQMQADALYSRIVAHEAAVEAAKESGAEPPVFDATAAIRAEQAKISARRQQQPQQHQQHPAASDGPARGAAADDSAEPSEYLRAEWDRRLAELPEKDRAAELEALRADFLSRRQIARVAEQIWEAKKQKKGGADAGAAGGGEKYSGGAEGKQVWEQLLDRWRKS